MMKGNAIAVTCASLLILLWVYAAINKLIDHQRFVYQLSRMPGINEYKNIIAIALPLSEIVITALLCFARTRIVGFYLSLIALTAFTIYIASVIAFNDKIPCSCGGIIDDLRWQGHIVFNGGFMLVAVVGMVVERRKLRVKKLIG